jgi:hypothetical protein
MLGQTKRILNWSRGKRGKVIEDPLWKIRAKIASRSGGHALEKRFLDLDITQLYVLYAQALAEEAEERKEKMQLVKSVNDAWVDNFSSWFRDLRLFVNPDIHFKLQELEKLEIERKEITAEEFPNEWAKILKAIPNTYVVSDQKQESIGYLPIVDSDTEEMIAGWVPSPYFKRNDGDT